MPELCYTIAVVVAPSFADQLADLLGTMPVWIAATDDNRRAAESVWASRPLVEFTEPGGLTTFEVDPNRTPEDWFAGVLAVVAGHHDHYSHTPGFSAIEAIGVGATPRLRELLARYRLSVVAARAAGFRAATPDGLPAWSPNDDVDALP